MKRNMTPREYSAARRGLPFGQYRKGEDTVQWEVCQGLVAVSRSDLRYVVPLLLFGVVDDKEAESGYSIAVYWHINPEVPWLHRIYALRTLRNFAMKGELTELERGLKYQDVIDRVHKAYPGMPVPTIQQFYGQFGLFAEQVEEVGNE